MGTVLIVLFVISLMIRLLGNIFGKKSASAPAAAAPKAAPAAAPAAPAAPKGDDTQIIAVITAAVAAYLNTSPSSLVVRPLAVSAAWTQVSRIENTKKIY
jgi:sodium pump decarboxylase gamma subunit